MRIRSLVALACAVLALSGCQKSYKLFHGSLPSSVKVKKLDLTNAAALTVMPYSAAPSVKTRAGEDENEDRLFIVDVDGNTRLASFTIEDSKYENTIWKEIRKTLTLVPTDILPLSQGILLLNDVRAVHRYSDWGKDAMGDEEKHVIIDLLRSLESPYILRVSDGALFKSPIGLSIQEIVPFGSVMALKQLVKSTSDGKYFVLAPGPHTAERLGCGAYMIDNGHSYTVPSTPLVICDRGNYFELKFPSEILQDYWGDAGFIVTSENRIVELNQEGKGCWSYDLDLNPLYLNYSKELQGVFESCGDLSLSSLVFDFGADSYILFPGSYQYMHGLLVYKVFINGDQLDCSLICFGENEGFAPWGAMSYYTKNGITLLVSGAKIIIDVVNGTYVKEAMPDGFPQEWNSYDENGIAYVMTDDVIEKFDLNTKERTDIPIHWEQVNFGGFVTYQAFFCNGVFSVSGRTRDAKSVTVLIDAETGNVSLTDLAEYSGSVVKTYYRLN